MSEDNDIFDVEDFSNGVDHLNWTEKMTDNEAEHVIKNGKNIGSFGGEGSVHWNVIKFGVGYFVCLNDTTDMFNVNETILDAL